MITIIERTAEGYAFFGMDEDGERWELGSATERIQDEGTEDEYRYFSGYFDTQKIEFDDAEHAARIIKKRDHNREIEIR